MKGGIENPHEFRRSRSREKLELAAIMLDKGRYSASVQYSYLSMFYAVRMLLIDGGRDSDNPSKIIELAERYLEPSGWSSLDMPTLLSGPEDTAPSRMKVSRGKAERLYGKACETLSHIEKDTPRPVA